MARQVLGNRCKNRAHLERILAYKQIWSIRQLVFFCKTNKEKTSWVKKSTRACSRGSIQNSWTLDSTICLSALFKDRLDRNPFAYSAHLLGVPLDCAAAPACRDSFSGHHTQNVQATCLSCQFPPCPARQSSALEGVSCCISLCTRRAFRVAHIAASCSSRL